MITVRELTESLERLDLSPLFVWRTRTKSGDKSRRSKGCRHFKSSGWLHSALICTVFS